MFAVLATATWALRPPASTQRRPWYAYLWMRTSEFQGSRAARMFYGVVYTALAVWLTLGAFGIWLLLR